jgi:ABC-type transport system involved in cytochrome bd biosynthesis fused ATPase/permease subunit
VLRDPFIFIGTIAHNIRLNDMSIDDAQVQAARVVRTDDFIRRLPGGFDAPVKERGAGLSEGQKQLIAFARAVAFNSSTLPVLDEATANGETETERRIQQALQRLMLVPHANPHLAGSKRVVGYLWHACVIVGCVQRGRMTTECRPVALITRVDRPASGAWR